MFKKAIFIALLAVTAVSGTVATVGAQDNTQATVEVRVWQSLGDAERLYISARPASGSWATLGTIRLPLDDGRSSDGRFIYGDIRLDVPLADRPPVTVEVRVWQHSLRLERVYVSARPAFGSWATLGTIRLLLDDGETSSFRYGDIRLGVSYTPIPEVPITFWGDDLSDERQVELREETREVVAYFADRWGVVEPDFELHVIAGGVNPNDAAWVDALGSISPPSACGVAVNARVVLWDWCATATHNLTHPLAHEYFHVLQSHLAAGASEPIVVSDWMLEGTAEYAALEYSVAKGYTSRADVEETLLEVVTSEPWDLRDIESNIPLSDTKGYSRVAFAATHLLEQTSEAAMLDFFRALPRLLDWREAFAETFGMATEEYYADFNAYVKKSSPQFAQVVLELLGPDGNNLSVWNGLETRVTASSFGSNDVREDRSASIIDGVEAFHYAIPAGDYQFIARLPCERYGGEPFGAAVLVIIANLVGPTTVVDGDEVVIQLPDWPSEINIHCSDHDRYPISGTVVSRGGHDVSKYSLSIQPVGIMGVFDLITWGQRIQANENGTFETAPVPEGYDYRIVVRDACLGGGVNLGYYVEGGGLPRDKGRASVVTVDGAAVSGVRIELPESLRAADDCAWLQ
ncbi:MAG: hypothetical protein F4052_08350 [Dehalococcoidia bacterium]|nr:hypothetical protein [Dehalococcoidia bacterium]MYK26937.1 hypothetical protein [Dehalococcoidia bacterium]